MVLNSEFLQLSSKQLFEDGDIIPVGRFRILKLLGIHGCISSIVFGLLLEFFPNIGGVTIILYKRISKYELFANSV